MNAKRDHRSALRSKPVGSVETTGAQPALSICIPAYNRPVLVRRALESVIGGIDADAAFEVVVADDSTDPSVHSAIRDVTRDWTGRFRYAPNTPRLGLAANFNRCVELAQGRYVLLLHDDDYLLPGAVSTILDVIERSTETDRVLLFGVQVVDESGRVIRRQAAAVERYLRPAEALRRLLDEASFVRFPAIVVRKDAYDEVGKFDTEVGNPTDFDMWTRLFSRFGIRWIPSQVAAYTVHEAALTTAMFTAPTVRTLLTIFDRVEQMHVLSPALVRRSRADWFHQFILAGTFRRLRLGDRAGAVSVYQLFDMPEIRAIGRSPRWLPVRAALAGLIHMPAALVLPITRIAAIGLSRTDHLPMVGQ